MTATILLVVIGLALFLLAKRKRRPSAGAWNEFWHLSESTRETAAQLSADQGARYT